MKIFINRRPVIGPYGGGNQFISAFHKYASLFDCEIVSNIRDSDVIFVVGLDRGDTGVGFLEALQYSKKLVYRCNENDARKNTTGVDAEVLNAVRHCDKTIFVSHWLKNYFNFRSSVSEYAKIQLSSTVIVNGVDKTIFKPNKKFKNGKVNIVSAHWSNNFLKGQTTTEYIDDFVGKHQNEYSFTFVGRTKAKLKYSTHIQPLFGVALGEELGKYDVCINASFADPGPNSVAEIVTCGIPTYVHASGGGGVEFAGSDHTFSNDSELESILINKYFIQNFTKFNEWPTVIQKFINFIKE